MKNNYGTEYYTAKDLQRILQVSQAKAYEILNEPECKAVKLGGTKRVGVNRFDAYMRKREKETEENMRLHKKMKQ